MTEVNELEVNIYLNPEFIHFSTGFSTTEYAMGNLILQMVDYGKYGGLDVSGCKYFGEKVSQWHTAADKEKYEFEGNLKKLAQLILDVREGVVPRP